MKKRILKVVMKMIGLGALYLIMLIPGYLISIFAGGDYANLKPWNFFVIAPLLTWGIIAAFKEQKNNYQDPEYRERMETIKRERELQKQMHGTRWQRFKKWTVDKWGVTDDSNHDLPPMPPPMSP